MSKLGTSEVYLICLGDEKISKIFIGDELIYNNNQNN